MELQPATADRFDAIHDVLREFGPGLRKHDWRRLVDYDFDCGRDDRGWVLVDEGNVVGFLGAIFSVRRGQPFCNVTSWIVKQSHRRAGLELLLPLLEMNDHTLLNLSPSPFTLSVFRRMGFQDLDDRLKIIPPVVPKLSPEGYELVRDHATIERILEGNDLRVFRHHRGYDCTHLVFVGPDGYSYTIAGKTRFRRVPTSFVYYVSDPERFAALLNPLQRALFAAHRTLVSVVDARLVAGAHMPGCATYKLAQPRLYRPAWSDSDGASPPPKSQIDNLYSEFVLLDPRRWIFNY
jgi:hypothetical protein